MGKFHAVTVPGVLGHVFKGEVHVIQIHRHACGSAAVISSQNCYIVVAFMQRNLMAEALAHSIGATGIAKVIGPFHQTTIDINLRIVQQRCD